MCPEWLAVLPPCRQSCRHLARYLCRRVGGRARACDRSAPRRAARRFRLAGQKLAPLSCRGDVAVKQALTFENEAMSRRRRPFPRGEIQSRRVSWSGGASLVSYRHRGPELPRGGRRVRGSPALPGRQGRPRRSGGEVLAGPVRAGVQDIVRQAASQTRRQPPVGRGLARQVHV